MIFLGQSSNYSFGRALKHLLTHGREHDSAALKGVLLKKYGQKDKESQVILYQTGRSALAAAFSSVVPRGSEIIIPGLTCIAVVRAVRAVGCEPVFSDIEPGKLQYDFEKLAETLEKHPQARAIVVQNTLGITIDIKEVEKLARQHKLEIIEDLAHSAGRFYPDGREVGTVGAATALSFGKGKAIDTISGGAVIVRKNEARKLREPLFRPHVGARWRARWYPLLGCLMRAGYHVGLGKLMTGVFLKFHWIERSADAILDMDVRLCDWQARLALKQLKSLPKTPLRKFELVKKRGELLAELKSEGFYFDEIWYDTPVSPARYVKEANFPTKECPMTVEIAEQIINLPTWYPAEKLVVARKLIEKYVKVVRHSDD